MRFYIFTFTLVFVAITLVVGSVNASPIKTEAEKQVGAWQSAQWAQMAVAGITTRVSVASDGTEGNDRSHSSGISSDGRFVVFWSSASNLVPGDTNRSADVFVHDRTTGQTERVSVASDGSEAARDSAGDSISADGRFVVFQSDAENLVSGDTNLTRDIFVYDRATGETKRISVASDGAQANESSDSPVISGDGLFVTFESNADNLVAGGTERRSHIYVHSLATGQTELVSVAGDGSHANSSSYGPTISHDGRFVAFTSSADNLIPVDDNGAADDVFVRDRMTGETEIVSVSSDGMQGNQWSKQPAISASGRFVAFQSYADNLVPQDTNDFVDVFVHDRATGQTERISVASDGSEANHWVTYPASISPDGRFVAFVTGASNLVADDTNGVGDVFLRDREMGSTERVSLAWDGTEADGDSRWTRLSADAGFVTFHSTASNMVLGDTNQESDIFVYERGAAGSGYSISGRVTDQNANPIADVIIRDGAGHVTVTNLDGSYSLTGLITGTYTITAQLAGYSFSPPARVLALPPSHPDQNFAATQTRQGVPWTLMVYLDAEPQELVPLSEEIVNYLESAADNANLQIVALWDRPGDSNSAYYHIQHDEDLVHLAGYREGENFWRLDEVNMAEPPTLGNFVLWARDRFPAQHYALVMYDHGTGVGGSMCDDGGDCEGDLLFLPQLRTALSMATDGGAEPIDILYMNACLMGMIETAYEIAPFARYYVASEHSQWANTAHYFWPVAALSEATTPRRFATHFAETYAGASGAINKAYTISVADLAYLNPLVAAVDNLGTALQSEINHVGARLVTVGNEVQRFDEEDDEVLNILDDYVDLYDFARLVEANIAENTIQEAAHGVMEVVDQYVIYESHDSDATFDLDRSGGVSIVFPSQASSYYDGRNIGFAAGTSWDEFRLAHLSRAVDVINWGPMLVDYFAETQPDGPDNPDLPKPVALQQMYFQLLPMLADGR